MDEEFAHGGGESDFGGFAARDQAIVEGFEDGVFEAGDEGGHVEGATDSGSAAADEASAGEGTAVAVEGGESGEGGDLLTRQRAEFWQSADQASSGEWADAFDLGQAGDFLLEAGVSLAQLSHPLFHGFFAELEQTQEGLDVAAHLGAPGLFEAVLFGDDHGDQGVTSLEGGGQIDLGLGEFGGRG